MYSLFCNGLHIQEILNLLNLNVSKPIIIILVIINSKHKIEHKINLRSEKLCNKLLPPNVDVNKFNQMSTVNFQRKILIKVSIVGNKVSVFERIARQANLCTYVEYIEGSMSFLRHYKKLGCGF
jgi:hypothetical protein